MPAGVLKMLKVLTVLGAGSSREHADVLIAIWAYAAERANTAIFATQSFVSQTRHPLSLAWSDRN